MTKERQALIDKFEKWLDSNPRKQITACQCANIAEDYHLEQLILHGVVKSLPDGDDLWCKASEMNRDNFAEWYDNL